MGSNPIGGAGLIVAWTEHWRAQLAVNQPPPAVGVRLPLHALRREGSRRARIDWPRRLPEGHHPLKVEKRVRLPSGLLDATHGRVAEWQTREPQKLVPSAGVGVRVSPRLLVRFGSVRRFDLPGEAGAQRVLIRPARPVRHRGLGLAGGPVLGRVS